MDEWVQAVIAFIRQHQELDAGRSCSSPLSADRWRSSICSCPATALVLIAAAGALIPVDAVDPVTAVVWSIPGAVLGDSLSFWLGRHCYRYLPRTLALRSRHPEMLLHAAEAFFFAASASGASRSAVSSGRFVRSFRSPPDA